VVDSSAKMRVAFQGEPGAFSEAAAVQLLGERITTVPRPTFDATFRATSEGAADALLVPVENSLAGSVVRVFDLLLESDLAIVAETILPIEMQLIAVPGASISEIRTVSSHPMALAQCERFFAAHPGLKRVPAEDTAGSVREVLTRGEKSFAAIAGRRAAERYDGVILEKNIQDNTQNYTRFVLLVPSAQSSDEADTAQSASPDATDIMVELGIRQRAADISSNLLKMSLAFRLMHRPGALLAALEPFAKNSVNLLKIESRPIHGHPWEYQFFVDLQAQMESLKKAMDDLAKVTSHLRILGTYPAAPIDPSK
jgi:prephenate dehydratase